MLRKIDEKFIKNALENKGRVYIEHGVFEPHYENQIVKERITILGIIFPFLKRKKVKQVVTGQDLVIKKEEVSALRRMGDSAPKHLKDKLEDIPYDRMFKLDKEKYGDEIVLAHVCGKDNANKFDILTKDGVILGRFEIKEGYYSPSFENALLPADALRSTDRHQNCPDITLEDVVAKYCAQNPETIEHIPEDLHKRFPKLSESIVNEIDNLNAKQAKVKNDAFSLS